MTLPSSDDLDRNDRAQLHGGGILHVMTDLIGFPPEPSVLVKDHLKGGAHIISSTILTQQSIIRVRNEPAYLPGSSVEPSLCASLKIKEMLKN